MNTPGLPWEGWGGASVMQEAGAQGWTISPVGLILDLWGEEGLLPLVWIPGSEFAAESGREG